MALAERVPRSFVLMGERVAMAGERLTTARQGGLGEGLKS
jgi:hypothetical protein